MADIALAEWQWDLGGVLMGADSQIPIAEVTGLGWAGVRDNDVDQPGMDGSFAGPDYFATRTVEFDAGIRIPGDPDACRTVLASLQAAAYDPAVRLTGGETMPLRYRPPGGPVKRLYGRLRRLDPELKALIHGWVPVDIAFAATDPTWYGDVEQTTEIPLGWLSGGGFTAPVVAPIYVSSGTTIADRPGWVTNAGDADTWPVIRITGPCSNVTITHAETGHVLALPTLSLASTSDWVELDTRPGRRSVVYANGGNAESTLSAASRLDLFSLPPGQTEIRWTAVDPTNTSRLRVTWRDAYTAL